jgi:hypothetical protein
MSTKTLRKRIALVAVSALGAGLLSVAPANATAGDGEFDASTGTIGLVGAISPATIDGTVGYTTRTATLLSTGTLYLSVDGATGAIKVSAGAVIASATVAANINGSQTCYDMDADGDLVAIKPTGAAGTTFSVTGFDGSCAAGGTTEDVLTVTIAATSVAGTANAAESIVRWDSNNAGAPTAAESVVNASTTFGNTLELYIALNDAYGQAVTSAGGALVVTASAGAVLGAIDATGAATAPTSVTSTSVYGLNPSAVWVTLAELTSGAGWAGTVTVTYNGVTVATIAGQITGRPATLTVTPYKAGKTGTTNSTAFLYIVKDAAGNGLAMESDSIVLDTSSNTSAVTAASGNGGLDAAYAGAYGDYVGTGSITCGVAGSSDVVLKYTNTNGTVIKSAKASMRCAGGAYEYSASFDKASYVQGEIATLTVTFKDDKGNLANSYDAVDTLTGTTSDITISAPMMTMVGVVNAGATATPAATAKPGLSGTRKYTFTVGTATGLTEGSYNAVVLFPTVDVATSAAYKVTTGSTGVTNADVLKAIVSLIASINKQIAALQKALLKK